MNKNKLVLAYSGGLDTSFCLKYLTENENFEVHTVIVNTGGFSDKEVESIAAKAKQIGATTHTTLNVEDLYYSKCIKYMVFGNILRNGTYPLSVSSERYVQAESVVHFAKSIGAEYVAHGSTGAGNDQIRFDMVFNVLAPEIKIITPIRDLKLTREEEIEYLQKHGVDMDFQVKSYSINKGIWGTSVGGKETLTSSQPLPSSAYPSQLTKTESTLLTLGFYKGEIKMVNGETFARPVRAIHQIEEIVSEYAIGRDIHIGDTILGIKGRVAFEAGAPLTIIKAHHALEKHVLTKWQQYWKEQLANWYGMQLHEAQYLEPTLRDIEKFMENTQENVTGEVYIRLYPYHFSIEGVKSDYDLMTSDFGDYGEVNKKWNADDVRGFTKILGLSTAIYNHVKQKNETEQCKK
ncbi:MAG: argininosuccinate synthase [Bacteroidales bacterium]